MATAQEIEIKVDVQSVQIVHLRGNRKPRDYRCPHCGRLIMRAVLVQGCYIEHRCARCARMCIFAFTPDFDGKFDVQEDAPLEVQLTEKGNVE